MVIANWREYNNNNKTASITAMAIRKVSWIINKQTHKTNA